MKRPGRLGPLRSVCRIQSPFEQLNMHKLEKGSRPADSVTHRQACCDPRSFFIGSGSERVERCRGGNVTACNISGNNPGQTQAERARGVSREG